MSSFYKSQDHFQSLRSVKMRGTRFDLKESVAKENTLNILFTNRRNAENFYSIQNILDCEA